MNHHDDSLPYFHSEPEKQQLNAILEEKLDRHETAGTQT